MIPRLRDMIALLEELVPVDLAEPWDNPGLQIGAISSEISKIHMALDPTPAAVRRAALGGSQLLLTHHPLIFKPIGCLNLERYPGNAILEAAAHGIAVMALHTNLDIMPGGINDLLADLLDIRDREVLLLTEAGSGAGLGRVGNLARPASISEIAEKVRILFDLPVLRACISGGENVGRVAVVGGSGGALVSKAYEKGAHLLVTGDISHHHALEAEALGISIIDGGHFNMEKKAFDLFADPLRNAMAGRGWEVSVEVDSEESDPMQWKPTPRGSRD